MLVEFDKLIASFFISIKGVNKTFDVVSFIILNV